MPLPVHWLSFFGSVVIMLLVTMLRYSCKRIINNSKNILGGLVGVFNLGTSFFFISKRAEELFAASSTVLRE
jgi:hypothetical protein